MAVKFLYYFIFTFIAIAVFLVTKKPYHVESTIEDSTLAKIHMKMVQNFDISKEGVVRVVMSEEVKRFATQDTFEKVYVLNKAPSGLIDTITSNKATLKGRNLRLYDDAKYERSDGLSLESQEAYYNLDSKVLRSHVPFVLNDSRGKVWGDSFVYQVNEGQIDATNIKAIIEEMKK